QEEQGERVGVERIGDKVTDRRGMLARVGVVRAIASRPDLAAAGKQIEPGAKGRSPPAPERAYSRPRGSRPGSSRARCSSASSQARPHQVRPNSGGPGLAGPVPLKGTLTRPLAG